MICRSVHRFVLAWLLAMLLSAVAACKGHDAGADMQPVGEGDAAAGNVLDASMDATSLPSVDAALAADSAQSAVDAALESDADTDAGHALPENPVADLAYDSFTKVFYTVSDGKGYYVNNTGTSTANAWWTQAELIEMAIDAYERKRSAEYEQLMSELVYGFVAEQGSDWTYNDFNDDIAWMVIASARAHLHTGNADFLGYAKSNWDAMYARAWNTSFAGGGLWWKTDNKSKNACVNGPGAIGAYLLYKATGDAAYLTKATEIYAWLRAHLFDDQTGAVYDNINTSGGGDDWTFTYNSGTFIGIANYLYQETHDVAYLNDAKQAADFMKSALSDSDGMIKENAVSGDGAAFKAIGFRWLMKLVADNALHDAYVPWLQHNANRAWANRRASDNLSWNDWLHATPHMILDSTGAMATVQLLQVVPAGGDAVAWYNSAPQNGRSNIEAERCDEKRGMTIEASEGGGQQLGGVSQGAWARYEAVDFGADAPTAFQVRASADAAAGGSIELRVDGLTGSLLGSCTLTSTGSWTTYDDFSAPLQPTTGVHDIYLVFKPAASKTYVGNINWLKLK